MRDGGSRTKGGVDRRRIGAQLSANRVSTIQGGAIVGLGVRFGRDGQGEGVVDNDLKAVYRKGNRNLRIDRIHRQRLSLVSRRIGGDGAHRKHAVVVRLNRSVVILHDGGLGALQIVMDNIGSCIAHPNGIQVNHRAILRGEVFDYLRICVDYSTVFGGRPALEHIAGDGERIFGQSLLLVVSEALVIHRAGSRGACRRVGVEAHVVFVRRPDRVEVVVRIRLVRGDLGRYGCLARIAVICFVIIPQEVRLGRRIGMRDVRGRIRSIFLVPADEVIARAARRSGDADRLVDLQRLRAVGGGVKRPLAQGLAVSADEVLPVAVAEPPDEGVGGLLGVHKDRLKQDKVVRILNLGVRLILPFIHRDPGVVHLDHEGRSGEDRLGRIFPFANRIFDLIGAVPVLHNPVGEVLARRDTARCRQGGHIGQVNENVRFMNIGILDPVRINILDADAVRAVDRLAPLTVYVKPLVDPETFRIRFFRIPNAVDTSRISRRIDIIVRRRDVGVVQHVGVCVEGSRAGLVQEPSGEFIAFAGAGRRADGAAVVDTEAHDLIGRAPAQRGVRGRHVRVHEHTDLRAVPLGVDRDAVDRHGLKGVRRGAGLVDVPAREGVALLGGLEAGVPLRIEGIVIELGDIRQVRDILADARAAGELVVRGRFVGVDHVVSVIAGAVQEGDFVLGTQIVKVCRPMEERRSVV